MSAKERLEGALFDMEDARVIEKMSGILDMKRYLIEKITNHPTALPSTKAKAIEKINQEVYHKKLIFLVSNYVLAHLSKDLKVLK